MAFVSRTSCRGPLFFELLNPQVVCAFKVAHCIELKIIFSLRVAQKFSTQQKSV